MAFYKIARKHPMPDLYKTRRQLIEQALDNLGVIATGQAPEPEDIAKMDNLIDPFLATMAEREVYYIPVADEIPVAAFLFLADALAYFAASSFGREGDANLERRYREARDELKSSARPARVRKRLRVDPALTARRC